MNQTSHKVMRFTAWSAIIGGVVALVVLLVVMMRK